MLPSARKAAGTYDPPRTAAWLEKREGADLDALARPCMRRRGGIGEGGVGGPAGAAVLHRLVDLEHQCLVRPHVREPVPALPRIPGYAVGLADPVLVAALVDHQRLGPDGLRIADRQRVALDRMVDRPPHLDDRKATP